jgi:hypothetical protein
MKLLVVGHSQHGKDSACEIICTEYGLTHESSSLFCCKLFLFEALREKYDYDNIVDCYRDRHNHQAEWYDLISEYNAEDAARLGKAMFAEFDVYCGLRNKKEFFEMKRQNVFDYSIWVDATKRKPLEPKTSMTLEREWMDFVIDNNGPESDLPGEVRRVMKEVAIRAMKDITR